MNVVFQQIVYALVALTVLSVVLVIISENRNPVKSVAWILLLIFLPLLGLIAYFLIGQDFTKKYAYKRKKHRGKDQAFLIKSDQVLDEQEYPRAFTAPVKLLKNIQNALLIGGNDVKYFTLAADKYRQMLADMEEAKRFIHLEYYALENGLWGDALKDLLIRKSARGVEVRIIYDDWGCWRTKKSYFKELIDNGVQVRVFSKVRILPLTARLNYRDHRKLIIIDGLIGYIGGMNISDRYVNGFNWGCWADTHCRIAGPGVVQLQSVFLSNWQRQSGEVLWEDEYFPLPASCGDNALQVVASGPGSLDPEILHVMIQAFYSAEKYIYVQTPYFIPPEPLAGALQAAAIRGLDVRLMISKRSDLPLVQMASHSYIREMLERGIKVYFYTRGFLHSKMMVVDGELSIMGSANADMRSFEDNLEVQAFIYGRSAALRAQEIFLEYQQDCEKINLERWKKRSRLKRFVESFMRLFAPLL